MTNSLKSYVNPEVTRVEHDQHCFFRRPGWEPSVGQTISEASDGQNGQRMGGVTQGQLRSAVLPDFWDRERRSEHSYQRRSCSSSRVKRVGAPSRRGSFNMLSTTDLIIRFLSSGSVVLGGSTPGRGLTVNTTGMPSGRSTGVSGTNARAQIPHLPESPF